jgi:predicted dehydrogenase
MTKHQVGFGVIGADHNHIYRMAEDMLAHGGAFRGWWSRGNPESPTGSRRPFPEAQRLKDYRVLLDDPEIDVVLICAIPNERAKLATEAMQAGKDVIVDKPGATTLADVERLREVSAKTGRIWSVNFSERYWIGAATKAAEIIAQGTIGEVIQTVGLGPHRGLLSKRPAWFFKRDISGGILCDIGSHQIDHFLFFTGTQRPRLVSSSVGNYSCPDAPEFEDFGQLFLQGERSTGYARVDWLTPDGQSYPSDSRLFLLGTRGSMEIRKYVDLCGRPGADHLFVVHGGECQYIDCSKVTLEYFANIVKDVRERTLTAEKPGHSFLVTELSIRAQLEASKLGYLGEPGARSAPPPLPPPGRASEA